MPATGRREREIQDPGQSDPDVLALVEAERLHLAIMLAKDVEACAALLEGEHVDPDRLDADWLAWAVSRRLVRLDERAIGRLFAWAAGAWSLPPELLCAECGEALIQARRDAA